MMAAENKGAAPAAATQVGQAAPARTIVGQLRYGLEYGGEIHYEFELRLPTVGDNIEAVIEAGVASNMRVNIAMHARALVRLGTIPKEAITRELLEAGLVDDDIDVLDERAAELKKKWMRPSASSNTTASPSLPSGASESAKTASGV